MAKVYIRGGGEGGGATCPYFGQVCAPAKPNFDP